MTAIEMRRNWRTGIYVGVMVALVASPPGLDPAALTSALPNMLLIVLYSAIGFYLTRTQLANRRPLGGWSVSGLALAIIFPTCALMHGVHAYYVTTRHYQADWHGLVIAWLAVPAAIYFVWMVQALYRGSFKDWNSTGRAVPGGVPSTQPVGAPAAAAMGAPSGAAMGAPSAAPPAATAPAPTAAADVAASA